MKFTPKTSPSYELMDLAKKVANQLKVIYGNSIHNLQPYQVLPVDARGIDFYQEYVEIMHSLPEESIESLDEYVVEHFASGSLSSHVLDNDVVEGITAGYNLWVLLDV